MNYDCGQIEELLVDFVDGQLEPKQQATVETHLVDCENCRKLAKALDDSMVLTQVIWNDNLTAPAGKKIVIGRFVQMAACILFAAGLFFTFYNKTDNNADQTGPVSASLTFAEIQRQIDIEGLAARLLAKAEIIKQNPGRVPNPDEFVQKEYRYIVKMYPDTHSAKKAAKLIR